MGYKGNINRCCICSSQQSQSTYFPVKLANTEGDQEGVVHDGRKVEKKRLEQ